MSEIKFQMRPVAEKRERKIRKRSIYDPMFDQFLESGHDRARVVYLEKA